MSPLDVEASPPPSAHAAAAPPPSQDNISVKALLRLCYGITKQQRQQQEQHAFYTSLDWGLGSVWVGTVGRVDEGRGVTRRILGLRRLASLRAGGGGDFPGRFLEHDAERVGCLWISLSLSLPPSLFVRARPCGGETRRFCRRRREVALLPARRGMLPQLALRRENVGVVGRGREERKGRVLPSRLPAAASRARTRVRGGY